MSSTRYASLYERMLANSEKPDDQNENGCWLWTGKTDGKRWPYPRMNMWRDGKNRAVSPAREMEKVFNDTPLDPDAHTIEHLCRTPLCINPDHWILLTRAENAATSQAANPRSPWVSR